MSNEIEKTIRTMTALSYNAKEVLQKLVVWATTTESTIDFTLMDQKTGGYTSEKMVIPTAFALNTPYWGTPFNPDDRRDSFIDKLRFYSNNGGWVYEKQNIIPDQDDPNYSQTSDSRFWEYGGSDVLNQYYHGDVALYTHVDALFRNKTTRFTHESTLKYNNVIDNSRSWYSYIDITGYNSNGIKTIMNGYSASINFGGEKTFAKFFNENVYVGYSAAIPAPDINSTQSLSTRNTFIDAIESIYIGCNHIKTPYGGANTKSIFIGGKSQLTLENGNTDIGIHGAKLYAYARDQFWLGRAYNSSAVASASNIVGTTVNIATYHPTSGSYIYLNIGNSKYNLIETVLGNTSTNYYKEGYELSARAVGIGARAEYVGIGTESSATDVGYKSGYTRVGYLSQAGDAFIDCPNVVIGKINGTNSGYLDIGANRYKIDFANASKILSVGGIGTSATFSGSHMTTSATNIVEISSIEDTIVKGGREDRYGKKIPTIIGGMWNDSKANLRQYHAEVVFYPGGVVDTYNYGGDQDRDTGYVWNKVKYYEVGTSNIKIKFQLFDIGGLWAVYARCVKIKDVPQKVYTCSDYDIYSSISNKVEVSQSVIYNMYDNNDDTSVDYGKGVIIHSYYETQNYATSRSLCLRHIEVYENINTNDIIIRTLTNNPNNDASYGSIHKYDINQVMRPSEPEPGYRKVCTIGKIMCAYDSVNYSYYEYGAHGIYTDSNYDRTLNWLYQSSDIFGWGTWAASQPNGLPIHYDRPSHFTRAYMPGGVWENDTAVSSYYAERPHMVVYSYSDVSSIYIQYKCVGTFNNSIYRGSYSRPGAEAVVITTTGNYRTNVVFNSVDDCGYNTREISRFLVFDQSEHAVTINIGNTALDMQTKKILHDSDVFLSPRGNGKYVMRYLMAGNMTDSTTGTGSGYINNNMDTIITGTVAQRLKINSASFNYISIDKGDYCTSVAIPKVVDMPIGYNILEKFTGQL